MGSYGELWGAMGSYGEIWGDMGRCIWGAMGGDRTWRRRTSTHTSAPVGLPRARSSCHSASFDLLPLRRSRGISTLPVVTSAMGRHVSDGEARQRWGGTSARGGGEGGVAATGW